MTSDLTAWQAFFTEPAYPAKFKNLRSLYEKLIRPSLKEAPLVAFYLRLQNLISLNLESVASELRGLRRPNQPVLGPFCMVALKDLLLLNWQVALDLKANGMFSTARLFRGALSIFDETAVQKDAIYASMQGLLPRGARVNPIEDRVLDYRQILEFLGADLWPAVNEGLISPADILHLIIDAALGSNLHKTSPSAITSSTMNQIHETEKLFSESDLKDTRIASLPFLQKVPTEVFSSYN